MHHMGHEVHFFTFSSSILRRINRKRIQYVMLIKYHQYEASHERKKRHMHNKSPLPWQQRASMYEKGMIRLSPESTPFIL